MANHSLHALKPRHYEVPLLIAGAGASLAYGLLLPTLTLKELVFWKHTFSILSGIQSLYQEKYYFLALIVFLFSVIFPIIKLFTLTSVWFLKLSEAQRLKFIKWLELLGKWSMLDVFVVAVLIVISKVSGLLKAEPHLGIYVFAFSVVLSMLTTMWIERLARD